MQEEEKEKLKIKRQREFKEKIKRLCVGRKYRDKEWIDKNIGEYCTWDNAIEYFWTIIEDEYYQFWNGEIILTKKKLDEIRSIGEDVVGLKGTTFLGRTFKYQGRYSHKINLTKEFKKKIEKPTSYGIYGIYKGDCLIYIGSTMRNFSERFKEHIERIEKKSNDLYVYSLLNNEDDIRFKILIDAATLKTNS